MSADNVVEADDWFAWRLLCRNNREVGRSPYSVRSLAAIRDIALAVQSLVRDGLASAATVYEIEQHRPDARWCWRVESDGETVARSSRCRVSHRESQEGLDCFRACMATAEIAPLVISMGDRPGPAEWRVPTTRGAERTARSRVGV